MSPHPEADASRLCLACGLCCAGAVYAQIPLDGDEAGRAQVAGFTLDHDEAGALFAAQPCPQLQGTACRLYGGWRPRACVDYACRLLEAVRAGDATVDEAVAAVARIKALIATHLPDVEPGALRAMVSEAAALAANGPVPADRARRMLAIGAVNREIDRVIRHPGQGTFRR